MNAKVVVSQLGARMHYAVPRIFASQDRLAHFYTDICATKGWPRIVNYLPSGLFPAPLKRLAGRRPRGVPAELTTVFSGFGIGSALRRMRVKDAIEETGHAVWAGSTFSRMVARNGFHDAAGLYAFSGDALEQMHAAKRRGLWTAVEQMIAPRDVVETLVDREMHRFPEWAGLPRHNPYARIFANRERAEWALADYIVCPSDFVRQHVIACGGPGERCIVVPYGVNSAFTIDRRRRSPGPLRVLTVGEVGLRKGSPYVAEAARLVGGAATFRMAGRLSISETVRQDISRWVELRGIIPRSQVADEFRWADVFLLPSLCEGSATAAYEALAAGLPVITTENSGTVVRDGIEGFIVPVCDAEAIALAVERLAANDGLRALMSANALHRAADFTVEAYGKRLLAALSISDGNQPDVPTGTRTVPETQVQRQFFR
ncbi:MULTISPECIES: glycosyltransferase family 4 protein [Rhizobium/Agrobacterium group]|uniref:Glycosyltransferase family 4 protein n=1 Tax=Neorhizobium petrolearium TaxID=515361 RepID=A0ABY8ME95_9HYPH|nr:MULTISPECIES: glycosyltransferase family 4 protein [Rhizobium/Agrobacterium group]MCC2614258.1 glycosyltransferase family 4 protein [Neorhizobium petrolearium]WGI71765.1 glycosyltransferase family 4 protein [Neorhizobium petrolearium]